MVISISLNKNNLLVFHFHNSYVAIESEEKLIKQLEYANILNCEFLEGKKQIAATLFAFLFSIMTPFSSGVPKKIFKVHDKLVIHLKNKTELEYIIERDSDINKVNQLLSTYKSKITRNS